MMNDDMIDIDMIESDTIRIDLINMVFIKTEHPMMINDMIRMGIIKMEINVIYFHNITIYFHFKKLFRDIRVFLIMLLFFSKFFAKKVFLSIIEAI